MHGQAGGQMKQALIVTGGSMDASFGYSYIRRHPFDILAAVDSGMQFFYDAKMKPDWIIGDFDSADPDVLAYFEQMDGISWIRLVPEKDDTDTEAAIRKVMELGCGRIHLLGGTGSRLDHMLGNVGLLGIGLEAGVEIFLLDPGNRIRMIKEGMVLLKEEQYGKYVSLLPVTQEVTGITLTGMKYPLTGYTMRQYASIGISNEIIGDRAEIFLKEGVLLVCETLDE